MRILTIIALVKVLLLSWPLTIYTAAFVVSLIVTVDRLNPPFALEIITTLCT